jgi:Homing endonuclease associated repeat
MSQPHPKSSRQVRARIPDDVLLADLLRVARQLNQSALSQTDYGEFGKFSFVNICRRFGSWKAALLRVNLEPAHFMNVSADLLLADIQRVATTLKTNRLRYFEYAALGKYSRKIIYRLFGRWQTAAEAAGLVPVIDRPRSGQELLDNLKSVFEKLGRYPLWEEMRPPLSKFGASA